MIKIGLLLGDFYVGGPSWLSLNFRLMPLKAWAHLAVLAGYTRADLPGLTSFDL